MLYNRSQELIHLLSGSLYPLTNISPFSPPSPEPLATTPLLSVPPGLSFLDSTYKWYNRVFVFLCLTYFRYNALRIHPGCCTRQDFLLSHGWTISHCECIPHLYPFIHWRIHIVGFLCNSLITNRVEPLSLCLLVIWMSFMKCLFKSLAVFLLGCLLKIDF